MEPLPQFGQNYHPTVGARTQNAKHISYDNTSSFNLCCLHLLTLFPTLRWQDKLQGNVVPLKG